MSSRQLQQYLEARAAGATVEVAAAASRISLGESKLTEAAIARHEIDLPSPEITTEGESEMPRGKPAEALENASEHLGAANDQVEQVMTPDFERGLNILRSDLNPLTEESAKIRGDQSAAWKMIEKDCHLNKKGAKFVHSLMRMDPEIRDDVLRTVYGLMKAAKIGISRDLVDQMGKGDAPNMPTSDEKATEPGNLASIAAE